MLFLRAFRYVVLIFCTATNFVSFFFVTNPNDFIIACAMCVSFLHTIEQTTTKRAEKRMREIDPIHVRVLFSSMVELFKLDMCKFGCRYSRERPTENCNGKRIKRPDKNVFNVMHIVFGQSHCIKCIQRTPSFSRLRR